MEPQNSLREVVAQFFDTDPARISPDFPLTGKRMQGSLARARLDAAIRRTVGLQIPGVYSAQSYGELETAIMGSSESVAPSTPPAPNRLIDSIVRQLDTSSDLPVSCGIDVEMVDSLPIAKDFWEDEFYKGSFTPVEIAYCLMQENPVIHFAARWCAKEALRKCDPEYIAVEMSEIELVVAKSSGPYLGRYSHGQVSRLPHAVSVSHTSSVAVAIVIKVAEQVARSAPPSQKAESADSALPLTVAPSSASRLPAILLAVIAATLALWALLRTF
jgi:phosphopantetheinyl transferase (holo-ACP synthase)